VDVSFFSGAGLVGLATLLFKWHSLFASVATTRLTLRQKRSKRWVALVESGRWKTAAPWLLEDAFFEAHGHRLPGADIRFALGRENTHALFSAQRGSRGMVRLDVSSATYSHWKGAKFKGLSYMAHSYMAFAVGYVPFAILLLFGHVLAPHIPPGLQWVVVVGSFVWLIMNIVCASWFEAAHRVVAELDTRFPAWSGADAPVRVRTAKKSPALDAAPRRTASRRTKGPGVPPTTH
jgi:hypothetical protein